MLVLKASVVFNSALRLEDVAALLSAHLFGGIPFVETDEFDEEPGVRLTREVLGFVPTICGPGPGFELSLMTTPPLCEPETFPRLELIYLSKYLEERLATVAGITVIPT